MYTVHIVSGNGTWAIVSRQAGGCTRDEFPQENSRIARSAAASKYGARPTDWRVIQHVGTYDNLDTATLVADDYNAESALSDALEGG